MRLQQAFLHLLHRQLWNQLPDGIHGGIGHTAQQLSICILQVLAALGIWRIGGNPSQLDGLAVGPAHMPACPGQEYWVVWGNRVQLLLCRVAGVLPYCVHPAAALDPLPWLCLFGGRLD